MTAPQPKKRTWGPSVAHSTLCMVPFSDRIECRCQKRNYCEGCDEQHSKRIDEALGMVTCAMIAVPFYLGGGLRGVISAVQWKESEDASDPEGFTARDLHRAQRLSSMLERLLNYKVLKIILDLNA